MSEKEKQILNNIAEALPRLDESQQQYMLGFAEGIAMAKPKKKKKGEK